MKKLNKHILKIQTVFFAFALLILVPSCKTESASPGVEFMPDMYRSPAVGTYVNYDYPDSMMSRKPVEGTIPYSFDASKKLNNLPYIYPNSNEGYEAAGLNLKNPLSKSDKNIEEGKVLYSKYCIHCHGELGNGDGSMVQNEKFPPPPSYSEKLKDLPEGKNFHSITYGKGLMGAHASQLTKEERWKIVMYVQVLQKAGDKKTDLKEISAIK